jgi:hypothetical protein
MKKPQARLFSDSSFGDCHFRSYTQYYDRVSRVVAQNCWPQELFHLDGNSITIIVLLPLIEGLEPDNMLAAGRDALGGKGGVGIISFLP